MSTKYSVSVEDFAKGHYIEKIERKYNKKAFDIPWATFGLLLQKIDLLLQKSTANEITDAKADVVICKIEFKILPKESAKGSGNRCIVAKHVDTGEVKILFVYNKSYTPKKQSETVWWKSVIKDNYPEYRDLI
jgi:hypothetical protein